MVWYHRWCKRHTRSCLNDSSAILITAVVFGSKVCVLVFITQCVSHEKSMIESPAHLLILDDDVDVARTIGFVAEELGFTVHCFNSPAPFFEAIQTLSPSHIALDLIMPGMDGVEVLRRLAHSDCNAALILISGMGLRVLEAAQVSASARGLDILGVLPTPFRAQQLRDLLCSRKDPGPRARLRDLEFVTPPEVLAAAIKERAISVAVQPKLDLVTQVVVGVEVLARWRDPERGEISPDVFIAVAEAHGLMPDLTNLVLQQALAWFAESPLRTCGSLAVNLSTTCLGDIRLPDQIHSACLEAGVPPEQLLLEITESSALDRMADSFDTLTRLRLKGFRLSVDDFGTGHSTFIQLARLPLSEIKIDRSFISRLHTSKDAQKIVEAIIQLAKSMGLVSVAEGVDNATAMAMLTQLGCSQAQGYLICRPLSGVAFDGWLVQHRSGMGS